MVQLQNDLEYCMYSLSDSCQSVDSPSSAPVLYHLWLDYHEGSMELRLVYARMYANEMLNSLCRTDDEWLYQQLFQPWTCSASSTIPSAIQQDHDICYYSNCLNALHVGSCFGPRTLVFLQSPRQVDLTVAVTQTSASIPSCWESHANDAYAAPSVSLPRLIHFSMENG
jgi:hypothetical protein